MMAEKSFYATGKRKTAIARVWLKAGSGNMVVNKLPIEEYFGGLMVTRDAVVKPLTLTESGDKFDVMATLHGGGKSAQMDALRHGISKALLEIDPEFRLTLKKAGLLTRDPRAKERKKYGQKGARARFQFSKR
jgi:small subunit ribosomal protein S9